MDEKKERSLRRRAIRWILDGMRSSIILKRLGRSRAWLSKWKKHFDQVGWEGLRSKSRSPHVVAHRYDGRTRRLVIQARRRLERRKVGLIGPRAIQTELRQTRLLRQIPGRSTIKRMLHEAGLIKAALENQRRQQDRIRLFEDWFNFGMDKKHKIFGTYYFPDDAWPDTYGLDNEPLPAGFWGQTFYPFTPRNRA